jgi:glycosyltransferase involved in cell wall biosynthesis
LNDRADQVFADDEKISPVSHTGPDDKQTVLSISVIIPLYNGKHFITEALESVFAQTVRPLEVIVVDDGSTDGGVDIVDRYAADHDLIVLRQTNKGVSAARNHGIAYSKGDLIALLDQDDIWYPNHLAQLLRPFVLDTDRTLGWVYSDMDEILQDGRLRTRSILKAAGKKNPKTSLSQCLEEDLFILPSTTLTSRGAFDAVGGFDMTLGGYEDDDLFIRLFAAGYRNVYINRSLSKWRMHSKSASRSPRMATSRMRYARKLLQNFPDEPTHSYFYARDVIVPRFLGQVVSETRLALRENNPAAIDTCLSDIAFLENYGNQTPSTNPARRDLLITAVIPLYNGAPFIAEALQSVLAQTAPPDEIIVVDDGSTDGGAAIVERMAQDYPIRLLRKENGGQSSARNHGVRHAHGDLIAFLDQDDLWYPHHLEALVKPFTEERPIRLGWSYSNLDRIDKDGTIVTRFFLDEVGIAHPKLTLAQCLGQNMFILPSASLISRQAFMAAGGFDEALSGYEDDDLFLRLFRNGYANVYINEPLSQWRIHHESASYAPSMARSRRIYAEKLLKQYPNDRRRDHYYTQDLIAPRFLQQMYGSYRRAVLFGTTEQARYDLRNLWFISRYQRIPVRLTVWLILPFLQIPGLTRLLLFGRALVPRPFTAMLSRFLR